MVRLRLSACAGVLLLAGCATFLPERLAEPIAAVPEPVAEPEPPRPALTVPEAYEAISLSVQGGDPAGAIAAYQEAELRDPDDPLTTVLLANLFLIGGDPAAARELLDQVLAADPGNTEALYLRSLVQAAAGDAAGQRATLESIVSIDPLHSRALASLGELDLQARRFAAATERFNAAIASEPDNFVARVGLGNVLLRQERYAQAEEQFNVAIALDPDLPYTYGDRARARALQYDLPAAESDLSTAIDLAPDYYWHFIDRGRVRLERRLFDAAEEDLARAIELDPDRFLGYALRGQARDAIAMDRPQRIPDALADFEQALKLRSDYTVLYAPIAVLYYLTGQHDSAHFFFNEALRREPRRYELALLTSLALKSGGRERESQTFLNGIVNDVARDSLYYHVIRYYLQPGYEALVLTQLRDSTDRVLRARMHFYVGAQLELLGRVQTAQASFREAEDRLAPGYLERRLATARLAPYRSP